MIFLYPQGGNPLGPIFVFDAELEEKRTDEVEWTEFAVESGATVSDFGWIKPIQYTVNGRVAAYALGQAGGGISRIQGIHKALVTAKDRRQICTLVTSIWTEDVVIKNIEATRTREEGESLQIEIQLQTILRPTVETVKIDPSRLRNPRKTDKVMAASPVNSDRIQDAINLINSTPRPIAIETRVDFVAE